MSKYKGNIVSPVQTVLSGTNYTGKANGRFCISEQNQALQSSLWAKGLTVPSSPTIGTAVYGDASATVSFTAPSDTGGQSITGYIVTSTPGNITASGVSSPIVISGLTNGTSYTFKVAGVNASGTGSQSNASNAITPSGYAVPDAPTIGTATLSGYSAIITFTPPSNTGGYPITSYTVYSSVGGFTATGSTSPLTITGLAGGIAYSFTVKATNSLGQSLASSASNTITTDPNIGDAYAGGFYGGKINDNGTIYKLIVAPKASGRAVGLSSGTWGVATGATSSSNGLANTNTLAALGAAYQKANFCKNLTIGGYNDWYLPAINELEVLYYFLKPEGTNAQTGYPNNTSHGANPDAVAPEPINTNYTANSPGQTTALAFRTGGSECFTISNFTSSTERNSTTVWYKDFGSGFKSWSDNDVDAYPMIAIRRVLA